MADNPFDQFDTPAKASTTTASAANPFDQFDAPSKFAGVQGSAETTSDKSLYDKVNDFGNDMGDAFVHHLGNIAVGIGQGAAHAVLSTPDYVQKVRQMQYDHSVAGLVNPGKVALAPSDQLVSKVDQAVADRESKYQAAVPTNTASTVGAGLGEALPWLLGSSGLRAAGAIPEATTLGAKVGIGALEGGTMGAATPVTSGQSYAKDKATQVGAAALAGGALPIVNKGLSQLAGLGQHVFAPQVVARNNLARLVGSDPATLAKLDSAGSTVPGVMPTTAQAAPSPSAVAAEKALGNTQYKAQFVERENQNNAARMDVLRTQAGDDTSMKAARDARQQAVQPFIDQYLTPKGSANKLDPADVLDAISDTQKTGLGARPTIRKALDDIASTIESSKDSDGKVGADVLDSIRQNVNDFLVSPNGKRASAQEALGVAPIRNKIVDVIGQHAPGYSNYLATYAQHSIPINTMEAARSILRPVDQRALNSAGAAPLSLSDLNNGIKRVDSGRYGVSPAAQQQLSGLQQSLKDQGVSNSLKFPGSDTAYNANIQAQGGLASSLLGPSLGGPTGKVRGISALIGAGIGEHVGGPAGAAAGLGIGAFVNKAADVLNKRVMDRYASGLLNPQEAAAQIRQYLAANSSQASALLKQYPQWGSLLSGSASNVVSQPKRP